MLAVLILMQEDTIESLRIQVGANREKEFGGYRSCCGHECSVNTTRSTKIGRWRPLDTWTAPREQNGDMLLAAVGFRMLDGSSSLEPQVRLCELPEEASTHISGKLVKKIKKTKKLSMD